MDTLVAENKRTYRPLILNEEQLLLKNSARDFLKNNAPLSQLRALRDNKDALGYNPKVWREMAEMGWTSLIIPEKYTGLNFGFVGLGLVLEETGRTLTASPLFSTALLGVEFLLLGADESRKSALLPQIAEGKLIVTLALEEGIYHQPTKISLKASPNEQGFLLTGKKIFVLDGHIADKLVVAARTEENENDKKGISLFLIDARQKNIEIKRTSMVDSRNAADIVFNQVQVSENDLLGELNQAFPFLEKVLDIANIGLSAEMLGMIQEAFERTIVYLNQRQQFGVPIGSFQALQHRAADMFCEIELCKSVVLKSLIAVEENDSDMAKLASLTKAKLCDTLKRVSNEAIQMFGGIGMTDDEEIGFFLKRARVAQQTFGDYTFHLNRFATLNAY